MKMVTGNLIALAYEGNFDVIVHGANCFCTMGGGIAKEIREKIPEAYAVDCETVKGDLNKLGSFSSVDVERDGNKFTVVNAYTQHRFGYDGNVYADYKAIDSVFQKIKTEFAGKRIGYPLIGCGLAGGDWGIVSKLIDKALEGEDHTCVVLPSNK